jgi:hypothetical protein
MKIKKWNWSLFFVIICVSEIGTLLNKNIEAISEALLVGLITGIVFGLPIAIITRSRLFNNKCIYHDWHVTFPYIERVKRKCQKCEKVEYRYPENNNWK